MKPVLLIDFGSTNTKLTAIDLDQPALLGTAVAFTTIESDIGDGLNTALAQLEQNCGRLHYEHRFACSSAAGGLRMITCGLVPALTAEAAHLASLGAGAKVIKVYSYELTEEDIAEIDANKPDILLLTGGVDGGNKECIIHNASMLARCQSDFPILLAGNRTAAADCRQLLAGRRVVSCPNVMPKLNELNIEPVQVEIRRLFLDNIIKAKGLTRESQLISGIMMPTPSAVKQAVELLAGDSRELIAVDLGGATTDVYSVNDGMPHDDNIIYKGLEEPYSKRTVEGDIGMRYSAEGIVSAVGMKRMIELSGQPPDRIEQLLSSLKQHPDALPHTAEECALDFALAAAAVETAVLRHAGTIREEFTPAGKVYVQQGKDLRAVGRMVLTGGAAIHAERLPEIAAHALQNTSHPNALLPTKLHLFVDKSYILSAIGLLAEHYPQAALTIMKKELYDYGTAE